jgi:L-iditol 2-dehydrogenase
MTIPQTMTAAVFHGPDDLRIESVPTPTIGSGEVLIAVRTCGICGTDLNMFKGEFRVRWLPLIPGHEFAGVIAAIGEGVTGVQVGDRVTADINQTCGTCYWCRRGENLLCPNLRQIGIDLPGAFAEYVKTPAVLVHRLPDEISFEQGASIEPLACAVHAQSRVTMAAGDSVAVIGGGSMGIIHAQLARARGAYPVMFIGRTASKLDRARRAGIECTINALEVDPVAEVKRLTDGRGADVVIEAAGTIPTYEQAFKMVRRGGTIVAYGIPPEQATIAVRPFNFFKDELKVIGAFVSHPTAWARAIALLQSGHIRPEVQFSLRTPLAELPATVAEMKKDKNLMKVFVVPGLQQREEFEG